MTRRAFEAFVVVVVLIATAVVAYDIGCDQPDCPTEDSCRPVYENGS